MNLNKSTINLSCSASIPHTYVAKYVNCLGIRWVNNMSYYLCVPMSGKLRIIQNLQQVKDKIIAKLRMWKWRTLSMVGRVTLVRSIFCSILIHILSNIAIPKAFFKWLNLVLRSFIWGHDQDNRTIHAIAWSTICKPINQGGLGISNIEHWWQNLIN